ncbi:hypothetical protein GOV14_04855 [Candidatus Pacearchaeota archaeon]|nr:hypothetical protein [Candidatus Pacearchaeota archaeon]
MKNKLSRAQTEAQIKEIFAKNPTPKEIKKVKRLAMSKNIKLKELRKKFCQKCLVMFDVNNSEIKIKQGLKKIKCKKCAHISRYKLK